jgi:cellulose biosynthesis protein BcsQ
MNLMPLVETIERLIKPAGKPYALVLNRIDPRATSDEDDAKHAFTQLGLPHLNTTVRSYKAHQTASGTGLTSKSYARTRSEVKATKDFEQLTTELLTRIGN